MTAGSDDEPVHDPDHARGELPPETERRRELAFIRDSIDAIFAHRDDKLARGKLSESELFARAEARMVAAKTWIAYDAAIFDAMTEFHDGHLTYHPPSTAAPARGYDSYSLGIATVLASGHLLVSRVEPGSDAAAAGVAAGDEVVAIDGVKAADALARAVDGRVWSRREAAETTFARTWTSVLYPRGDSPRARKIRVASYAHGGAETDVAIAPRLVPKEHRPAFELGVASANVPVVAMRSFDAGAGRKDELDAVLAKLRGAPGAVGVVIDVRGNRGGVDEVGDRVIADLAEGSAKLGEYRVKVAAQTLARRKRWKTLTAEADGFSPPQPLVVDAQPAGRGYHGRVAVIADAACTSTCEIVVAALRADLRARVVGVTTGGSSGAPVQVTLPVTRGKLEIPTWNLVAADGTVIEGNGVAPDEVVIDTPAALAAGRDVEVEAAVRWVTQAPATVKP